MSDRFPDFQFQTETGAAVQKVRDIRPPQSPQRPLYCSCSSQLTGSTLRHVFPAAAAASVPPESTAIPLRLLSPNTHPRSPRRLHRRPISVRLPAWPDPAFSPPSASSSLYPSHRAYRTPCAGQRDPAEERGLLHRRREVRVRMMSSLLVFCSVERI